MTNRPKADFRQVIVEHSAVPVVQEINHASAAHTCIHAVCQSADSWCSRHQCVQRIFKQNKGNYRTVWSYLWTDLPSSGLPGRFSIAGEATQGEYQGE